MRQIVIDGKTINDASDAWIVAEIGHNHQGDLKLALRMMDEAKLCGCDAVKFQKRTLSRCYTKTFLATPYNSVHSYGRTYGEHRQALEFGMGEYRELMAYAKHIGITCFATAFDEEAADFLEALNVPCYKIASGDLTNLPLIRHVSKKGKPVIISTGGGDMMDIYAASHIARVCNAEVAFLHCVCMYPVPVELVNLQAIDEMKKKLPHVVGYSCHYNGPQAAKASYYFGARIVEKHFTLDHTMRGSDHALSLQPEGMRELVRDLRRAPKWVGDGHKERLKAEWAGLSKMAKSLYPAHGMPAGTVIKLEDIAAKSPAVEGGYTPARIDELLGRVTGQECSTAVPFTGETVWMEE